MKLLYDTNEVEVQYFKTFVSIKSNDLVTKKTHWTLALIHSILALSQT